MDFAVLADHRVKIKESKNIDKYFDLARELKKLWNMRVKGLPIVVGLFGTVSSSPEKGLEELEISVRIETIQITQAGTVRRVLET